MGFVMLGTVVDQRTPTNKSNNKLSYLINLMPAGVHILANARTGMEYLMNDTYELVFCTMQKNLSLKIRINVALRMFEYGEKIYQIERNKINHVVKLDTPALLRDLICQDFFSL